MNILFLSTENPFPVDHGHHIRTYHALKALAEEHAIYFIGFAQSQQGFDHIPELKQFCESVDIFDLRKSRASRWISILKNFFTSKPYISQKYMHPAAVARIQEIVTKSQIDFAHFDMLHLAGYRYFLPALPAILVTHNVESLRMRRWANVEKNPVLRTFLIYQQTKIRRFERKMCTAFNCCVTVSHADRLLLQKLCDGGRFVTVPNGVDSEYFRPNGKYTQKVRGQLVWTGSMKSPYNRDAVLYFVDEIWPLIRNRMPEAQATFVGASPPERLKQLGEANGRVHVAGYVDDVRPFVDEADIFIAPMRSGSGTKIKVLNAMAQGKAVVTTSIGIEGIEATSGKEVIVADTPSQFAEQTVELMHHREKVQEMGRRARKVIEQKYDWQIIAQSMRQLYQEIANG